MKISRELKKEIKYRSLIDAIFSTLFLTLIFLLGYSFYKSELNEALFFLIVTVTIFITNYFLFKFSRTYKAKNK